MDRLQVQLDLLFQRHEEHSRAPDRFGNCLSIAIVVLVRLDKGRTYSGGINRTSRPCASADAPDGAPRSTLPGRCGTREGWRSSSKPDRVAACGETEFGHPHRVPSYCKPSYLDQFQAY